jgi:hypothetical protein
MRQSLEASLQPMSEVCQENVPPCSLTFHQGVDVSFGGKNIKEIDGRDFGIKAQGIVDSL